MFKQYIFKEESEAVAISVDILDVNYDKSLCIMEDMS